MNASKWAAALATAAWTSVACAGDTFDVRGMRVEQHGDRGAAVILVPGLASGAWVFRDTIAALAGRHRVYAVTLPGFDGVPATAGDPVGNAVESLRELVASRGLEKPVVVGHSLGGTLGLVLAARYPDLVGGVVAVDGLPVFPTTENVPPGQRQAVAERARAQFANAAQGEFEAQQLAYMRRVGLVDEARAADVAKLTSRSDPRAVGDYAAALLALDLRPELAAIRAPVLAIVPYYASDYAAMGLSEAAKRAYYASLLHGVARLTVVAIAPARHFAMLDQPQAFTTTVQRFLDGPHDAR